jgi:alpha-glucosidase (family GH31 glycosyl hydrolase)
MVNEENPDYAVAAANNYLVHNSKGVVQNISWWHGSGALLDYTNPDAVAWWHKKMDLVLNAGVDGFKCDGTDPYILAYLGGAVGYDGQPISYRQYSDLYYRDFLEYTKTVRGDGI